MQKIRVNVCLIAIGTRSTGYGHITRTIEIFEIFRQRVNAICLIKTDNEGLQIVPSIPGLYATTSDQELLNKLSSVECSLLVCDFLDASVNIKSMIINNNSKVASVSPISTINEVADVIITRIPVSGPIKGLNLHGSRFTITYSRRKKYQKKRLSIGVNFGGSDPEDQLSEFVKAISNTDYRIELSMMLGPGYRGNFSSIFDSLVENPNIDFSVHQSVTKFWEVLEFQDVLVVSGGLALYEAIHKTIPVIAFLPEKSSLDLIPDDLKRLEVLWVAHTVDECISKLKEIHNDLKILDQQKKRLSSIDFSRNTQYVVEALAKYVK